MDKFDTKVAGNEEEGKYYLACEFLGSVVYGFLFTDVTR